MIEYTGERISRRETKKRAERALNYLFTLDKYWTIDGSANGSGAQYINHCCEPNLAARIVKGHILYISLRDIRAGKNLPSTTISTRMSRKCLAPAALPTAEEPSISKIERPEVLSYRFFNRNAQISYPMMYLNGNSPSV